MNVSGKMAKRKEPLPDRFTKLLEKLMLELKRCRRRLHDEDQLHDEEQPAWIDDALRNLAKMKDYEEFDTEVEALLLDLENFSLGKKRIVRASYQTPVPETDDSE